MRHTNTGKHIIKAANIYLRNSVLLHTLLGIGSHAQLLSHILVGASLSFYSVCDDLQPTRKWVVYAGQERYPLATDIQAISLFEPCKTLQTHTA